MFLEMMPIFGEIMLIYCYGTGADPYRNDVHRCRDGDDVQGDVAYDQGDNTEMLLMFRECCWGRLGYFCSVNLPA